ncbi:MAG: chalcone isomerase family protein [Polaromonas sp.]|nr:chalcone isomerase family protein [Polaromonas sp.]
MKTSSFKKTALNSLVLLPILSLSFALAAVTAPVQAQTLLLNGTGIRHQSAGPLYSAGLYLDKKLVTSADVMGNHGAKQLRVVMLRDVSAAEMGDLLASGMAANASDDELSRLIPALFSLGKLFGEQKMLAAGDSFQMESTPGGETTISIQAKLQSKPVRYVFAQPGLFGVMLRMWLGGHPADEGLKSALLGEKS